VAPPLAPVVLVAVGAFVAMNLALQKID
jgi:hypothetical protein